jgi:hypothetical protein
MIAAARSFVMIGFHIDMNTAQFQGEYLETWLRELAHRGYDTIIWEIENNVHWETCPECCSPDAFTKNEFKKLLDLCRKLKLEPIPLFQTLGHCEYVLKHEKYSHLKELPKSLQQYCPMNPDLRPFLTRWIEEYLDLFGEVKYFHLGADEAWSLGRCETCREYVNAHSLSELYMRHMNFLAHPLISRGITPIIWADMVLTHPEAMDLLDRRIMLFDWMYDIYHGQGKVWVWGQEFKTKNELSPKTLEVYGKYLFPRGDEPGREPETFFNSDALADHGFRVVNCPGSSSFGDNVFSPRNWYHMTNTFDSLHKGRNAPLEGTVLTSWTIHLFPWELQLACIDMPGYVYRHPDATIEMYQKAFVADRFGSDDDTTFMKACGLLSKPSLFTYTASLGLDKDGRHIPSDHVEKELARLKKENKLQSELENSRQRLAEYTQALALFETFTARAIRGKDILTWWHLAARNLINRARASIWLLENFMNHQPDKKESAAILTELRRLREETAVKYQSILKPTRLAEYLHWLYEAVETALEKQWATADPDSPA